MRAVRRPPSALLRAARVGSPSFIGGSPSYIATRRLSTPAASDLCPYGILGLAPGTQDQAKIKLQFRKLALKLHPDVVGSSEEASSSDQPTFVDVLAAFEILMREAEEATERRTTAPSNAARGGTPGERPRARRPGKVVQTERSLGDILCERLMEEPAAAREVWDEIVEQRLRVRESMLEAVFRACGAKDGAGGLPAALSILRDAKERGLLDNATKQAACIFVIKWCKEDNTSFAKIMAELSEEDKNPEVRETLAYANALYSGLSEGYSA